MNYKLLIPLSFLFIPLSGEASELYKESKGGYHNTTRLLQEKEVGKPFKELCQIIDQYAESTLQKGNVNSLVIAIYRDGEVYQQYYGELDKESKQRPSDNTLYEIASISKVFAGSLVAKAVLEQKITLNDDIRIYLKGDYSNLQFEGTPITIQNLVTHTLGLQDKAAKELDKIYKKTREGYYENRPFSYTMSDLLEELKTVKLDKKPGTFYDYNSVGPELVTYILEQVYHKPYKELLQELLDELNLKQTSLNEYDRYKKQLAISYNENGEVAPLLRNPLLGGSYGMISSLPDLTKFMKFQLESNQPFIKEASRLLFKEEEDGDDKGYFWDVGYGLKEGAYYGKTGTSIGVQSGILVCPDSRYGMIIMMNNTSDTAQDDWLELYNKIETALITYPKINLVSLLEKEFKNNFTVALEKYKTLEADKEHYLSGAFYLNNLGYNFLNRREMGKAIKVFELAIQYDTNNANLYDSLGEAYFLMKDYKKSLLSYHKSLELDDTNDNAKNSIREIENMIK